MSIKRLNYFTGQFLKEKDFKDEQDYHINALSNHNKYVHSWGIASGLDVSLDKTENHIILDKGMAIDRNGKQIILEKSVKIDIPNESELPVFLTISLKTTETDPSQDTEFSGNTRILEEPLIEFRQKMSGDKSVNIFLAEIKLDPENKTIILIDKIKRKIIGLSDDIKVKSITFDQKKEPEEWPIIRGIEGKKVDLEIKSRNTSVTGDLHIAGILTADKISGELDKDIVGMSQIKNESISVSKIKSELNIGTVEDWLDKDEEKAVAVEKSNTHLFLVTSVIPITTGSIEWKWRTEFKNNQLSYTLMLKNLSNVKVKYHVRYFDISEK
jgi:hypothetical protein